MTLVIILSFKVITKSAQSSTKSIHSQPRSTPHRLNVPKIVRQIIIHTTRTNHNFRACSAHGVSTVGAVLEKEQLLGLECCLVEGRLLVLLTSLDSDEQMVNVISGKMAREKRHYAQSIQIEVLRKELQLLCLIQYQPAVTGAYLLFQTNTNIEITFTITEHRKKGQKRPGGILALFATGGARRTTTL